VSYAARTGSNRSRLALNVSHVADEKRGWLGLPGRAAEPARSVISAIASKVAPISFPYRRKSLLSPAELAFYNALKAAVGDRFIILLKVGVRDLCEITHQEVKQAAFNRVAAKQVDFVLCDQTTLSPVVAIELDDSTNLPRDRAERDVFMNELFRVIGVALIRHRVQTVYDTAAIDRWVQAALARLRPAS
jgi:uncharacterized protein DUF2726